MNDLEGLLRQVIATPDDDTLRLVCADAFEERGNPDRAAFIRAQVEMSTLPKYSREYKNLDHKAATLFAQHAAEWMQELPPCCRNAANNYVPEGYVFDEATRNAFISKRLLNNDLTNAYERFKRGFFEKARFTVRDFITHGGELIAQSPARSVNIDSDQGVLSSEEEVATCPHWRKLRALHFGTIHHHVDNSTAIVAAATGLKHLSFHSIGHQVTRPQFAAMIALPHVQALEGLSIKGQRGLENAHRQFAALGQFRNLNTLNLDHTSPNDRTTSAWLNPKTFAMGKLQELNASSVVIQTEHMESLLDVAGKMPLRSLTLGDDNALSMLELIANAKTLGHLEHLKIELGGFSRSEVKPLAVTDNLPKLAYLEGMGNSAMKGFLEELFTARRNGIAALPALREINDTPLEVLAKQNKMEIVESPAPPPPPPPPPEDHGPDTDVDPKKPPKKSKMPKKAR